MRHRRAWSEAFVLGLLPYLAWRTLPIQLFPPPGWVDPAMYLGYALNLPVLLRRYGFEYHGMRLPWVLSAFVAHHLLPPTPAQLVLVFGFHSLAIVSLYLIVMPRHGRRIALLSTLFLTLNPMWIAAITRGYVDGPANAFQFAAVAAAMKADQFKRAWLAGVLAGAFTAFAFHTHPVVGAFTVFACLVAVAVQRPGWRHAADLAVWASIGFAALTAALGAASVYFGGPFLFPLVSLDFGKRALAGFGLNYRRPVEQWLPAAYDLFPPVMLLCCGLAAVAWRGLADRPLPLLSVGCSVLGVSLAALAFWDAVIGGSFLQTSHAVTFLIPGQALTFAGLLATARREGAERGHIDAWLAGLLVIVGAMPFAAVRVLWHTEEQTRDLLLAWILLVALAGGAAALLRKRHAAAGCIFLLLATTIAGVLNGDTRQVFRVDGARDYAALHRASDRVNSFIRKHLDADRAVLLWFNRDDFTTGDAATDELMQYRMAYRGRPLSLSVYDSLSSLWLWDRATLNFAMPALAAEDAARLTAQGPTTLVVFCPQHARCYEGLETLERNGYSVRATAETRVAEGYISIVMVAADVRPTQ